MSTQQTQTTPDTGAMPVRRAPLTLSIIVGVLAMAAALGIWWAGYATGLATFPPFDLADLIIRSAPGDVAIWAIANFQFAAQDLALLGGLALFLALGVGVALALRQNPGSRTGAMYGLALAIPSVLLAQFNNTATGAFALAGLALWFGATLALVFWWAGDWIERLHIDANDVTESPHDWVAMNGSRTRREVLKSAMTTGLLLGGGGWLAGALLRNAGFGAPPTSDGVALEVQRDEVMQEQELAQPLPTPVPAETLPAAFDAPDGVRPRITSNEDFYTIDISTRKPALPDESWTLKVHGMVDQPLEISYVDLLNMPSVEMDGTLMCISYTHVNDLISSTRWTGVPLRDVMQMAGIQDGAVKLVLRGAGGYSDSIEVSKALEAQTLLAYGMNGETLPRDHGFPCRLYVPNIYGEKNVKWLQEIEVVDYDYQGYWQERGWSDDALVLTFASFDTPSGDATPNADGIVPIGGIAFAGSRGIQSVRLKIDSADWVETELEPYDPELLWQRWRYDWRPEPGSYTLTVQATDLNGNEQVATRSDPFPDGFTGLHNVRVRIG